jgi:hypothetical protein
VVSLEQDDSLIPGLKQLQNELHECYAKLEKTTIETSELIKSFDHVKAQQAYTQWEQLLQEIERYYGARHSWVEEHTPSTLPDFRAFWEGTINENKSACFHGMGMAIMIYRQPSEARTLFERALSLLGDKPFPLKVTVLQAIGNTYQFEGKLSTAADYQAQADTELKRLMSQTSQQPS